MIQHEELKTLTEFSAFVADKASEGKPYWFRGTQDSSYKLVPSLYRHKDVDQIEVMRNLELDLIQTFLHRAPPFQTSTPNDLIELLFFMQHHGVPTRLLDWSENPFIALFFALEKALWDKDDDLCDSAVWIIDPILLNSTSFYNNGGSDKILSAKDDLLNAYKPDWTRAITGKLPLAMWGVHNSSRIVAQRGVFVLFGSNSHPIEEDEQLKKINLMQKIIIPKENKKEIAKSLFNMGITDSVIYPDLDGLGREIKNRSGFWRR